MCRHCSRYVRELTRIRAAARALYADAVSGRADTFLARVLKSLDDRPSTRGTP
jgi:hypothetical protein